MTTKIKRVTIELEDTPYIDTEKRYAQLPQDVVQLQSQIMREFDCPVLISMPVKPDAPVETP